MSARNKKQFQIKLYKNGKFTIQLSGEYLNRHEMEDVARHYIKNGLAESMGAPEEVVEN